VASNFSPIYNSAGIALGNNLFIYDFIVVFLASTPGPEIVSQAGSEITTVSWDRGPQKVSAAHPFARWRLSG